jgi:glycosyltransferase involved in cell wall biosynthesis
MSAARGSPRRLLRPVAAAWARRRHARAVAALARCAAPGPRVLAIGHWRFPVRTQTFVYQELTAMVAAGFELRLAASRRAPAAELAPRFAPLASRVAELAAHPAAGRAALARFRRERAATVADVLGALAAESGLAVEALLGRPDVLRGFAFASLAEAFRADYLHSYFFYEGSLAAWLAARLLGLPRGVVAYADHRLADYPLKVVRLQLADAALVVASCARVARELAAIAPECGPRILIKPNTIDPRVFTARRRAVPTPGAPLRVLAVSRIDPKKGLLDLVEAGALLAARGLAVEIAIAGGADDSPGSLAELARLRARLAAPGASVPVTLLGPLDESALVDHLHAAHLFVAPAVELADGDADGIPTALLEAMASGLPVVATDAGAIAEALTDGREGRLVPQRSPPALAAALAELAADPAARARMGEAAARTARARFAAEGVEPALHERLRTLL